MAKIAFWAVFAAVGIPYWLVPYNRAIPALVIAIGVAALVTAGAILAFRGVKFATATLVPGLAVPAAVLARVVVEVTRDPTSHNLWPFEIVFAAGLGVAAAFVGALLGRLLARATGRGPGGEG
jgi:hypothetical protein